MGLSLLLVTCGLALSTAESPLSECTADSDCSGGESRCCKKPSMGQPHPRGVCYDPSDSTCCTDGDPNSGEFHVCGSGTTCCQALSSRCCNTGEKCEANLGGGTSCKPTGIVFAKSALDSSISV